MTPEERQAYIRVQRMCHLIQIKRDLRLQAGRLKCRYQCDQLFLERTVEGFVGSQRLDSLTNICQARPGYLSGLEQFFVQAGITARFQLRGCFQLDQKKR